MTFGVGRHDHSAADLRSISLNSTREAAPERRSRILFEAASHAASLPRFPVYVNSIGVALHFIRKQNSLRHFAHGLTIVHAGLLNFAEGFLLVQPLFLHQQTFGPLNDFARLQLLA